MSTIHTVLLALLVLDALALTVLILLQQGKGADVGAAFGSGSANTMFGASGGTSFLTKATAWLAIGFFVIAFSLAYLAKEQAGALGSAGIPQVPDELTLPAESVDSVDPEGVDDLEAGTEDEEFPDDLPDL